VVLKPLLFEPAILPRELSSAVKCCACIRMNLLESAPVNRIEASLQSSQENARKQQRHTAPFTSQYNGSTCISYSGDAGHPGSSQLFQESFGQVSSSQFIILPYLYHGTYSSQPIRILHIMHDSIKIVTIITLLA
jgi:hypothetical protein